jgi:hypothetical protein
MFSLDQRTTVTLTHINKRTEVHGAERKHAMDLFWMIEGPNTLLDKFPGLRKALYRGDDTADLPGVESVTPNLRTSLLEGPFKIRYEGTGFLLTLQDGPVSGKAFELGSSDVNSFKVDAKDGGSIVLKFRSQHVGLDQATMGRLNTLDGKQLEMLAAPPELQDGSVPERMTKAQEKAAAKKAAQDAFTTPFKFGVAEGGGLVDRSPLPDKDKEAPSAGDAFADAVISGKTTPAKPAAAKKTKPRPRTGKGG